MNKAFTVQEQAAIVTTTVDNSKSQGNSKWSTSGGKNTQDKVFLLSYAEAKKYFSNNQARMCAPTDYAIKNGAFTYSSTVDGKATGWWWLRSPGSSSSSAASVSHNGALGIGNDVTSSSVVRPAFWLNLESGIY